MLSDNGLAYGLSGMGKSTFLTTMYYSLLKNHTQEELNLYILDFASETLKAFVNILIIAYRTILFSLNQLLQKSMSVYLCDQHMLLCHPSMNGGFYLIPA